jgi:rhamnogalacturonan endolyase
MRNCFAYRCSLVLLFVALCVSNIVLAQEKKEKLIFSDEFTSALDTSIWKTEIAPLPNSTVYVKDGQLFLDTKGGVTVWLKKKLKGNIRIEYSGKVLVDTGANDRLSDLNAFWMATDPKNKNLFIRDGVLESYDSLKMYYVGMGGNTNSTTRFRKYQGNGEKTLLQEYKDKTHLLEPNKDYHITIEVIGGVVRYIVNGETFFEYKDSSVLKEGYFGFRSTKSRQSIDWVKVYEIKN